jgi:uncharacterized membrane protein
MFSDERQMAAIVYVLFLAPLGGLTHLIGLVLAYVARDSAPDWLKTHYTYLIRTFWIGVLYFLISGLLCVVLVGFVLLPVVFIWLVVRCAIGLTRLVRSEPVARPLSWTL